MTTTATPKDFDRIGREAREQFFGFFVWARLAAVPVIVSMAAWVGLFDTWLWRRVLMGFVVAALTAISIWDVWLYWKHRKIGPWAIPRNTLGAGLATLVLVVSTGGLDSPFVPVLFVVALVTTVFVSPLLGRIIVFGLQIPAIWGCAVVAVYELVPGFIPDVFGGGTRASADVVALWTRAVVYTGALSAIVMAGGYVRVVFEALIQRSFDERDEQLRLYADQARALTTLSSEIAHELKNPLASVKGLSALVARGLEGKPAERMEVLRGEVDRMQTILQEFLNYSRPLVPLALQETDLTALARETIALHDGMARERGVDLEVHAAGPAVLQSDPRKIKQILINIVQNALDVAPRGSTVDVTIETDEERGVVLKLRDRGPGLSPEVAGRLFEAGVTSKATGSGLGLTVARALARQHGGDLDLSDHPEGGCVAALRLPRVPPVEVTGSEPAEEGGP